MQAKMRTVSFLSFIRVIIRKRYADPRTTMRNTRSELRPRAILRISSIQDDPPKAPLKPRDKAALFSCGITDQGYSCLGSIGNTSMKKASPFMLHVFYALDFHSRELIF